MSYFDEIRQTIIARLIAEDVASGRINESAIVPEDDSVLPVVNVYTLSGSGESDAGNANQFNAELTVSIDGFDTAPTDPQMATNISALLTEIMDAVMTDHVLAARFKIKRYSFDTDLSVESRERLAGTQLKITGAYQNDYEFTFDNDLESIGMSVKHGDHTAADVEIDMTEE